jgi:uncharacterized alpha-E superfamily protein
MLKINYASSQDALNEFSWRQVIKIYTDLEEEKICEIENNSRAVLQYMLLGKENSNSILNIITLTRENARSVQEHITKDLWQCINEYYHLIQDNRLNSSLKKDDPVSMLDILIKQVMLYYGTAEITMERGEGRSFMNIGKYLERSIQSVDILNSRLNAEENNNPDLLVDTSYWKNLLLCLGGHDLYLKTYRHGLEAENVLEQVILNNDFPRSVIYSVNNINRYFDRIKNDTNINSFKELSFLIGRLQSRIRYSSVQSIIQEGPHKYLKSVKNELYGIGNALNEHYFANS